MKAIHKFTLEAKTQQRICIPNCIKILSVENQNENIVLYAMVETEKLPNFNIPRNNEKEITNVEILIFGTGHKLNDYLTHAHQFLGTIKLLNDSLVFHVFYRNFLQGGVI